MASGNTATASVGRIDVVRIVVLMMEEREGILVTLSVEVSTTVVVPVTTTVLLSVAVGAVGSAVVLSLVG